MRLRGAACVAALVLMAGGPVLAQDAKLKPDRAPGVQVERINKLMVGDRAPELEIATWVKGDAVTGFEEGKVYVVECWATWCGPCIAGMPHVSELQKEYKDKGVTVIGVNIWDDPANVEPFMTGKGGDEKMQYTVAVEEKIEGEKVENGKVARDWMAASGQNGIPTAFIVDQNGYVAWIGHPMTMDEPLAEVVAGKWDIVKAAKDHVEGARRAAEEAKNRDAVNKLMQPIADALQSKKYDEAYKSIEVALKDPAIWDNSGALNYIAWSIADPDVEIANRDAKLALKAAERAAELTEHKNPAVLDTLAWSYYHAGMKDKAIATETKAISMLSGDEKAQYEEALARMKK